MAAIHHPLPVSMYIICLCYLLSLTSSPPGLATALSFSFNFSSSNSGDLCLTELRCERDARMGSGVIDLTKNELKANTHSAGRASYGRPVPLWDNTTGEVASFSSNFTFQIRPQNETDPMFPKCDFNGTEGMGDGMAFFLASYPSRIPPNSYGMNLALFNDNNNINATGDDRVVAVEFDTFLNPIDHSNNHVGIDVNSIDSRAYTNVTERLGSDDAVLTAEVTYDNRTGALFARLQISGDERWYTVNTSVDMKKDLPQQVAVGFSGASGICINLHQVLSWSFSSTLVLGTNSRRQRWLVPVVVPSAAVAFLVLLAVGILVCRRHIWDSNEGEEEPEQAEFERGLGPRRYSYRELAAATKGFAEEEKLGRGGFGSVYRGSLRDQDSPVAIKMFSAESSAQGRKEFEAEVKIISRLRHRNLVHLLGWSDSRRGLLLVYQLVPEGSLDRHIHTSCLTWAQRYKIILGLGSALRYLHTEWAQCVLHGDIKPSNILLDSSLSTKLGDFGLARLVDHGARPRTTQVIMGTAGYIDPEFIRTRRLTTESDVYSFGMVLLEIVSGRRPMDMNKEQPAAAADKVAIPLLKWVWDLYEKSAILEAVDERLNGDEQLGDGHDGKSQVHRALVVGLWCTHPDPSARPSVMQLMNVLQSTEVTLPILSRPGPSSYIFQGSHGYNASSSSANVCSDVSWASTGR
ncbi:L-type lectin-domain containing receptor kinase IX.1 [Hordeum vulgare]|nr:L-type lectin-domain containing receptor kinase IX.1 [Hordeum vulgare]